MTLKQIKRSAHTYVSKREKYFKASPFIVLEYLLLYLSDFEAPIFSGSGHKLPIVWANAWSAWGNSKHFSDPAEI